VFTPNGDGEQIGYTEELDVPDIAVPHKVIAEAVKAAGFELEQYTMPTGSYYKEETLFLGKRQ
jgi:hypothetical protein